MLCLCKGSRWSLGLVLTVDAGARAISDFIEIFPLGVKLGFLLFGSSEERKSSVDEETHR